MTRIDHTGHGPLLLPLTEEYTIPDVHPHTDGIGVVSHEGTPFTYTIDESKEHVSKHWTYDVWIVLASPGMGKAPKALVTVSTNTKNGLITESFATLEIIYPNTLNLKIAGVHGSTTIIVAHHGDPDWRHNFFPEAESKDDVLVSIYSKMHTPIQNLSDTSSKH